MSRVRRAVIDVGTNSVKLLVAEVSGANVWPLWEGSRQTRLGKGLYEHRRLQTAAIASTARAVARFALVARAHQVEKIRVIATSAARDASNANDLISAVQSAAGLPVEVISGEQEAEWAFQGVTSDAELASMPLLLLDMGGGSTEVILGHGHHKHFQDSFALGAVRLLDQFPHSDPPRPQELRACRDWLKTFLSREVRPRLEPAMLKESRNNDPATAIQLVGCGGTASILARIEHGLLDYDRARIEATHLSLDNVQRLAEQLWRVPLSERRQIPGLPPKRADIILTGILAYEAFMEEFGFADLRITTRGLRFAAVMGRDQK